MASRTIIGNLAADPEVRTAGSIQITKLRVVENTGEMRKGEWYTHPNSTTHFVEAKFSLGENAAATLHSGDAVIVVGDERSESWGDEGSKSYGRVITAKHIGPDLERAIAQVKRTTRVDDGQ